MTEEQRRPTVAAGRARFLERHGKTSTTVAVVTDETDEGDETPSTLAPSPTVADGRRLHRMTHRPDDAA